MSGRRNTMVFIAAPAVAAVMASMLGGSMIWALGRRARS